MFFSHHYTTQSQAPAGCAIHRKCKVMVSTSMETADGHFKLAFCSITYEVTIPSVHL